MRRFPNREAVQGTGGSHAIGQSGLQGLPAPSEQQTWMMGGTIGVTSEDLQEGDREKCLDSGMNDHVPKPVAPQQLASTIERWIGETKLSPVDDSTMKSAGRPPEAPAACIRWPGQRADPCATGPKPPVYPGRTTDRPGGEDDPPPGLTSGRSGGRETHPATSYQPTSRAGPILRVRPRRGDGVA